jgi:hypothetical protein
MFEIEVDVVSIVWQRRELGGSAPEGERRSTDANGIAAGEMSRRDKRKE